MSSLLRVAIPVPVDAAFDYCWAGEAPPPAPGTRVAVPFGRGTRVGVVLEHPEQSAVTARSLKPVDSALDAAPILSAELLGMLRWAAEYYHHPIGEVVSHALPRLLRQGRALESGADETWQLTPEGHRQPLDAIARRAARQAEALTLLSEMPMTRGALREHGVSAATLERLAEKGWAAPAGEAASVPGGVRTREDSRARIPALTAEQRRALDTLAARPAGFSAFLLHGVTGSGKTEVFLRLVAEQLDAGRQTLVLVPEIGLTPQLVERLRERFGANLAITHSALGDRERLDAWRRAREGRAGVIVGTRSAVFAPLARPGLIVVDEEHDPSYKQQHGLRYSARDLAVLRARRLAVPVVLASATPSLESVHNASLGRYRLVKMPTRIGAGGQPEMRLIDLNRNASRRGLSTPLLEAIDRHLDAGNQVLLFLNRRGFAPTLFCSACRRIETCIRCDARLTVHAAAGELRCHHCGSVRPLVWGCAHCGTERIAVGAGTQRVDEELKALYPQHAIGRLDRDATARKGALGTALDAAASGRTRIIVGTQMLAKGHDFARVTLVAVLNADQGLLGTDFRSDERLAQTIVQVAGRAGRRETPGEVLIQTHHPEHPLLRCLLSEGYAAFARLALDERSRAGWPPYAHLAVWRAEAARRGPAETFLARVRASAGEGGPVVLLGPAPEAMERKGGRYRMQLLLKCRERAPLHELLGKLLEEARGWPQARRVRWSLDVDPSEI